MNKPTYIFFLLVLCYFLSACSPSQPGTKFQNDSADKVLQTEITQGDCSLRLYLNPQPLQLTDLLLIHLEVTTPEGYSVIFPEIPQPASGFLPGKTTDTTPSLTNDGKLLHTRMISSELLIAEKYQIPPLTINCQNLLDATKNITIQSNATDFQVTLPTQDVWDTLDIDDKTAMVPLTEPALGKYRRFIPWLAAAATLLLLIVITLIYRHLLRQKQKQVVATPPPQPPHIVALRLLEKLIADDLPKNNRFQEFFQRLSDILRQYIEGRFQISAPEQTTEEFLYSLATKDSPLCQYHRELKEFLNFCDLVKFAKHVPNNEDITESLVCCRSFIEKTHQP